MSISINISYRWDQTTNPPMLVLEAFSDAKKVGQLHAHKRITVNGEKLYPLGVDVDASFRRQGIATRLYEEAERLTGMRIMPGDFGSQKPDGIAFRKAYEKKHGPWT